MEEFPDIVYWSVPAFLLLMVIEMISYRLLPDPDKVGYTGKDTVTSLAMGVGSEVWAIVLGVEYLLAYSALYWLAPVKIDFAWWMFPALLVAQDFFYYWKHRSHHVVRFFWASHVVHHSSEHFNLSTAMRHSWFSPGGWIFYAPLILLGFHPPAVLFCHSVNLLYQFWVHTERIGKLPRPIEFLMITPSHHRVHHAAQGSYLDRNFGGIFVVWDRLFGSFAEEVEKPRYGLTKPINTYNPFRVAFHEWSALARDLRHARGWSDRFAYLVRPPGWHPEPRARDEEVGATR
ncbi:Sterol desaturase/sphingolipid hydroxylase, fatty acid hydroxylase superfamily [Actinokineospora alba]|uniref:Sterol desaturase/sphingolipid hydroxylase, fatty acid hydroxylase superfamily n=1 Tax=Actinokineospora alba TaxID=504798 RepID=A0A1H0HGR3_9PSEU|nr:sterol desaturase family protein [Actinokineospora alba]TDP64895.1 sterol desaturase/sphingolipid hydroxylase (fatty acid hydroxylase superfamily) [Actinokineospora alba]SDH48635.1 Sterol desaturase/sphingolipid hydroxylase, fatty acid hydroxylase superfamily [Actinokineospora alba]SDO18223.1 Sterol desaturase/sphingolipid hydroxylase, fatty acid hydroxylase superfamily [Actinokineospora alba]